MALTRWAPNRRGPRLNNDVPTSYVNVGVAPGDNEWMPLRYCGDRSIEAAEWMRDYRLCHHSQRVGAHSNRPSTRLTGVAGRWMDGPPGDRTLADIVSKFRKRFGARRGLRPVLLREFWSRCQGPEESLAEFIEEMTHLARRMGLDCPDLVRQVTLQGLRPNIQRDVALQQPTTKDELAAAAAVGEDNASLATDATQLAEMHQMIATMQAAMTERPVPAIVTAAPAPTIVQEPVDSTAVQLAELCRMIGAMQTTMVERASPVPATACAVLASDRPTATAPSLPANAVVGSAPTHNGARGGGSSGRRGRGRPWHSGPPPQRPSTNAGNTAPGPEPTTDTVCRRP